METSKAEDKKILHVMTEHTGPFKILIEVLKELLPEAILEFHKNYDADDDDDDDSSDSDSKKVQKKKR